MLLIIQPAFCKNFQEFANKRFIDTDSIKKSNMSGYYIPYEYFYVTLYLNDGSSFFRGWEDRINNKIGQILEAKAINCRDRKVIMLAMDIFDTSLKSMVNFVNFPYSNSRFQKVDANTEAEYRQVCQGT